MAKSKKDDRPVAQITTTAQEQRMYELMIGSRQPKTPADKKLLDEIKKRDGIPEIPGNL